MPRVDGVVALRLSRTQTESKKSSASRHHSCRVTTPGSDATRRRLLRLCDAGSNSVTTVADISRPIESFKIRSSHTGSWVRISLLALAGLALVAQRIRASHYG